MSATMARQGGQVQLEQSDMRLALIMAKMAKGGFLRAGIQETQQLILNLAPKFENRRCGVLCFPGITRGTGQCKDIQQWFVTIKRTAAFLGKIAQQRIHRHAGGAKAQVHLHHNGRHLGPQCYLRHLMTVRELDGPKQKVCHPDMLIYIHRFPALDVSILIHLPRIAWAFKILFHICWLMKVHRQVSTLSAAW